MDERRMELKRLKKASATVRRKHTALWSWLSILSLVLALTTTLASVCCLLFGGAIGAYCSGKLWEPEAADPDAVYFTSDHANAVERKAALEELQYKAVTEGAVLLKNNGALPLSAEINVDVLSVGLQGVAYGEALVISADTPEECQQISTADPERPVVLVLNTPTLPRLDFLEKVDACLWTGGTACDQAVADLLTGKSAPAGALAALGEAAEHPACELQYMAYVAGETESFDYAKSADLPFGYGMRYTTFSCADMALDYDVETDLFTVSLTVTNTGDRAGKEIVQLYVRTPDTIRLAGFLKTEVLEPGDARAVTLTVERASLTSYDDTGAGGYILPAGDYYFTVAADAHTAANQILATLGHTPENTEGRMDAPGEAGLTGIYIQTESDAQSYRLSAAGAEVKNRLGQEAAETPAEMSVTGAENGLKLQALRGLAYDDPLWDSFLDQMRYPELALLVNLGLRSDQQYTPAETVPESLLANAFDTELACLAGRQSAEQGLANEAYCISVEDIPADESCLAGDLLAARLRGIREKGILAGVKPEITEDMTEKTVREQILEPYRQGLQQAGGAVTADPACFDILKTEWGYQGVLLSAKEREASLTETVKSIIAGRNDPAVTAAFRERCHRILYNLVNSAAMNGVGEDTTLRRVSLPWFYGVYASAGIFWILHGVMGVMYSDGRRKWKDSREYRDHSTMKLVLKTEKSAL